jgi:hypothetical protein
VSDERDIEAFSTAKIPADPDDGEVSEVDDPGEDADLSGEEDLGEEEE